MIDLPLGGSRPIPKHWKLYSVDEIKSPEPYSCVAGPFGSNISSKYFVDQGIPVIRGKNLTDDLTRFVPENFVFVTEQRARQKYVAQHVQAGDLVFTCWGTIGQVGFIPDDGPYPEYIISNKQLKLRVNPEIADPLFVYYYLASREGAEHIRNRATGSAVPGINLGILKSLKIALPSLPTQQKIVAILSAYDDLIDNNNRRIALLEEAIHRLYREWFVHLRFPGHEHTPVVAGVPEGWEKRPLKDFGEVITGKTPSTKVAEYYDGDVPFIKTPDMHNQIFVLETAAKLTEMGANSQRKKFLPEKTIMVSCIGTLGVVAITSEPSQTNQQINSIILENPSYLYYCYFALKSLKSVLQALGSSGATMGNVNKHKFETMTLLKPSDSFLTDFHDYAEPAFEQILNLQQMNLKLQEARDALLPRLMNGSLAV